MRTATATVLLNHRFYPSISLLREELKKRNVKLVLRKPGKLTEPRSPIINWGLTPTSLERRYALAGSMSKFMRKNEPIAYDIYNHPFSVMVAASKVQTFSHLKGKVNIPYYIARNSENLPWERDFHIHEGRPRHVERYDYRDNLWSWKDGLSHQVIDWANKNIVFIRKDSGSGGDDIKVVRKSEELPNYLQPTQFLSIYVKKVREYRIHASPTEVISVSEKRRELDVEQTLDQKLIRNRANGWVFCRRDVAVSEEAKRVAMAAVQALDLQFGAVDMIENKKGEVYVLEVNTAPGLEGQTLQDYADFFERKLKDA